MRLRPTRDLAAWALLALLAAVPARAQSHTVVWDMPGAPVPPAVAPQGYYVYRNTLKIATLPANVLSYALPDPYLATDVVQVSAFATDPTTGVVGESALMTAVQATPPPTCVAPQLTAKFYSNQAFTDPPSLIVCESAIDYFWPDGTSPGQGVSSDFSDRHEGVVTLPASGTLRITATTDDGVRVFLDNTLWLESWLQQGPTAYSADVAVVSGAHALRVDHFDSGGPGTLKVAWLLLATPQDTCVATPLRFSVLRWPAGTTGNRRFDYNSDRAIAVALDLRTTPWSATATDARGCTVKVVKP